MENNFKNKIFELKQKKNILILAHYYQEMEIQLIADFVGDSFELSKKAKTSEEKIIVFCGVRFMAQSAKLLSPSKKVLLPAADAGCPMADMITPDKIAGMRAAYPNAAVVCYINSSAETKAAVDICCTSSNAVRIVKSLREKQIIFVPDKNLGSYVERFCPDKEFIYMDGHCPIHNKITAADVEKMRSEHPTAKVAVHPECIGEVVDNADFTGSTSGILQYCEESGYSEFIIGTETGIVKRLEYFMPDKKFYPLTDDFICPDMKKTTLENLYESMLHEKNEMIMSDELINRANLPLERMLAVK